ncbi:Nucleic acid-binding proteins superfamily [Arabidopsis thaliana]|uniref:Nucleic acid-binding proteins superfamily n=1 Tax=Arabidopsis thaliana TaxID=3702 RepID=A0A1P8ARX7_ARATH|nr:Nucleic acid-binding proteins superfamily [Arabidopsis thaliana]ANM59394.1 Nucleic acid-binding proteins superfamily [Arabidopsis thaliana]|eukprot:NP_001321757.1 Nucleic acid-binding proteins superfamily [Arabidopsis thaliana]
MQTLLCQPCKSLPILTASSSSSLIRSSGDVRECIDFRASEKVSKFQFHVTLSPFAFRGFSICREFAVRGAYGIRFCSREDVSGVGNGGIVAEEEIELLNKPNPLPKSENEESGKADDDAILEPFLKFFKPEEEGEGIESEVSDETDRVSVEYYDPKPGDFVVGVVVSGNENKLDVNIGADMLGTMLTKEILPLYDKELDYLLCDLKYDAEEFLVNGKMGIVKDDDEGVEIAEFARQGRPVVEIGTVVFAEVLGRTLSGRPLLSSRRYFRRIAWHRVRQIKQLNEPIEVKITEWNTGGLLTRIEGLRAFIPKQELVKKVNTFTELKENVGRRFLVQITRLNEDKNDLILSEKVAWEKLYLREGTLLEGTVVKILPYGAQVKLGDSSRSGLLHISNITRRRIGSVSDVLQVDESVKVLVVKSLFPDKISLR